jgi:glutathione S-transferase
VIESGPVAERRGSSSGIPGVLANRWDWAPCGKRGKIGSVKLYNADLSPNCLRVRAAIEELGLRVELVEVDLRTQPRPAALLAVNPNAKVPAFVDDDGFSLFESRAINTFLASKRPERDLYPADAKRRAIVDQWSYWQALQLGPAMQLVGFQRVFKAKFGMGPADEAVVQEKLVEVERNLPILDRGLEGRQWLAGELSLADFAVAASFYLRKASQISLSKTPNVERWIERVEALPSWQRALPKSSW